MATYTYNISEIPADFIDKEVSINQSDSNLIESFEINTQFNQSKHRIDLLVYSLDNVLQEQNTGYQGYSQLLNSAGAGKSGASNITINPKEDMLYLGYESGDVRLLYTFTNNLFTDGIFGGDLFIEKISPDGTEIRALSTNLKDSELLKYVEDIKSKLNDPTHFSEFKINFGNDINTVGLNIDVEETEKGTTAVFKLYEPLPTGVSINSEFTVEEIISNNVAFEIESSYIEDVISVKKLKGPNFQIELAEDSSTSTEFLNYNELFSYPISSSNFKLHSLLGEKGASITVQYSDYKNFIHFSSAEERIRNFHYKLALLESYETNIDTFTSNSIDVNDSSGSVVYYNNLIKGVVNNFDHYDRFLYYGSGSNSWPKLNSSSLYTTTSPTGSDWFIDNIASASVYDNTNYDILINTIPTFLREDSNNENYLMFVHMIAQHFDNIWIYMKAMSDRYDNDNRLDYGIAKDIVRSAIESYGIKLYNSNHNTGNLFSMLVGETPSTGSELNILSMSVATSTSFNSGSTGLEYLQPVAKLDYEREVHKRIYHNLPYLTQTKGTERGLRALINCFGIPANMLSIKQYGGAEVDSDRYFGPEYFTSSSVSQSIDTSVTTSAEPSGSTRYHISPAGKVRLDNTGSIISGSTLSRYVSTVKNKKRYSDDSHQVQVGFNIARGTNEFIDSKVSGSFDIDNYIGDPREGSSKKYESLNLLGRNITDMSYTWDDIFTKWNEADWDWDDALQYARSPRSFIRLLNFFDSSLFRMIKDFVPARTKVDTGIIIESHKLARSKAQQVSGVLSNETISGSLTIGELTGTSGGSYENSQSFNYTTNYSQSIMTPKGKAPRNVIDESPQFTGEFSGSLLISTDGEVGKNNPFLGSAQPIITFDLTLFNLSLPIPPACIVALSSSYVGEFFEIYSTGSEGDAISGSVQVIYPTLSALSTTNVKFAHDYDSHEFFTIEAEENYAAAFHGWYSGHTTGSTLYTTSSTLSVYYEDEQTRGNKYYAIFN